MKERWREWQKHEIVLNSGITAILVRQVLRLGKSRQKVMLYEKSAKHGLDLKEQKLKKEGMNACNQEDKRLREVLQMTLRFVEKMELLRRIRRR